MALSGVKEYDELPARVGWIDVDMLRWVYERQTNPPKIWSKPVIGPVLRAVMIPGISHDRVVSELELARTQYQRERKV